MFKNIDHIKNLFSSAGSRFNISIFIALLVHTAGVIGIVYFQRDFFLGMTSVNLLLMFTLLLWNEVKLQNRFWYLFILAFAIGFFTEVIGVNTGLLFGSYAYGNYLGPKISGVPLLIGINWFCIVYCSVVAIQCLPSIQNLSPVFAALGAAFIATIFDWVMEPVAMEFNYWIWENNQIPFFNYVCWFCIAYLIALIFIYVQKQHTNRFSIPLLMIQFIFFVALRVLLD